MDKSKLRTFRSNILSRIALFLLLLWCPFMGLFLGLIISPLKNGFT